MARQVVLSRPPLVRTIAAREGLGLLGILPHSILIADREPSLGSVMKAMIKGISCTDVPSLAGWQPADPRDVYVPITLYIGTPEDDAADLFQVVVATPAAIQGRPQRRRSKSLVIQE